MDLRFSSLLLVMGLFMGSSALTAEECEPLVKALPLTDLSVMHGRMNLVMGYINNKVMAAILKTTESFWLNLTEGPSGPSEHVVHQKNKMNGTCVSTTVRVTVEDGAAKMQMGNLSIVSHVLPSSEETTVFSFNYTATNFNMVLQALNLSSLVNEEMEGVIHAHAVYLFAKESTVKDSDMGQFKEQASCLGFTGEPNFLYNPENSFCVDGEGITVKADY
ncbi:uncharacterized protein LOC121524370 [Cheilinus undulatus]|uniref:uncharacterized protein LOC121524370 n=1 Tax=Cheilinus undulatus TaxID=241271 RepID=UPI001BD4561D|nr:uncharacterized protein LOC121524370 [Cheilinus undulatus]